MQNQQTTVIEQTSKKWKAIQLIGAFIMFAGVGLFGWTFYKANATVTGPVIVSGCVFVAGLGLHIYGQVRAWWHHG